MREYCWRRMDPVSDTRDVRRVPDRLAALHTAAVAHDDQARQLAAEHDGQLAQLRDPDSRPAVWAPGGQSVAGAP